MAPIVLKNTVKQHQSLFALSGNPVRKRGDFQKFEIVGLLFQHRICQNQTGFRLTQPLQRL